MNERDRDVVRRFVERAQAESTTGLLAKYRISGGAPGDSVDEHVEVGGDETVRFHVRDEVAMRSGDVESALARGETVEVLRSLAGALPEMLSREEARFLPDALVGTVTIEVDGQATTLFFHPDRDELRGRGSTASPALGEAVARMDRLADKLLRG